MKARAGPAPFSVTVLNQLRAKDVLKEMGLLMGRWQIAREISYASSVPTRGRRTVIRLVENATGRFHLVRRASGHHADLDAGDEFWRLLVQRCGISLDVIAGTLDNIPRSGPLILVANHPYGILDGLVMAYILSALRGDFRILAHRIFHRAEELNRVILPVDFDETPEAVETNLATRKSALSYLGEGGAIGIFPGGTVSTAERPFGRAMDPQWRSFTAKMILKSDAEVVPIYFDGQNSRLFQVASHMGSTLRLALLLREFKARLDTPVKIAVGKPLNRAQMMSMSDDPRRLMDWLRARTYALSPAPLKSLSSGYEFEDRYRQIA
jgi:putative hemolysin